MKPISLLHLAVITRISSFFLISLLLLSVVGCNDEQEMKVQTQSQKTLDTLAMNREEKTAPDSLIVEKSGVYYGFKDDGFYALVNLFYSDSVYFGSVSLNGEQFITFKLNESELQDSITKINVGSNMKVTISESRDSAIISINKRKKSFEIPLSRKFVFGHYDFKDSLICVSGFYPQYLVKKYGVVTLNNSLRENTLSVLTNNVTDQLSLLQDSSMAFTEYSLTISPEITFYSPIMFSYVINYSEELNKKSSIYWFETDNYEIGNDSIKSIRLETFIGSDSLSRINLVNELNKKLVIKRGGNKKKIENPTNFEDLLNYVFYDKKTVFIYPSRKSQQTKNAPLFISIPHSTFNINDSSEAFIKNFNKTFKSQ